MAWYPDVLQRCATKDDAIAFVVSTALTVEHKRSLYRAWCQRNKTSATRTDLDRVSAGRRRELQRPLF